MLSTGHPGFHSQDGAWQLNLALAAAAAEHWLSHRAACLLDLAQETLCSTKATDVSHEARHEATHVSHDAFGSKVCGLLQLAMLKEFLFKVIKLLSAERLLLLCLV